MTSARILRAATLIAAFGCAASSPASAAEKQAAPFALTIRNHQFDPVELHVPANQKVELRVTNEDATPEEFESTTLHREKLVSAGQTVTIYVGPLTPGRYEFFGDFNPKSARGFVVAQ